MECDKILKSYFRACNHPEQQTAPRARHPAFRSCCAPRRLRKEGAGGKLRLHVAGAPCIDWSAMGQQLGLNGATAVIFECWVHERLFEDDDVIIHECTRNFPIKALQDKFEEKYVIVSLIITPQHFGWPCSRPRRWTIMVKKAAYIFNVPYTLDGHGICWLFGRAVDLDGNAFFCA
eukprot:9493603-Pyramimonas_sp.AAC.2